MDRERGIASVDLCLCAPATGSRFTYGNVWWVLASRNVIEDACNSVHQWRITGEGGINGLLKRPSALAGHRSRLTPWDAWLSAERMVRAIISLMRVLVRSNAGRMKGLAAMFTVPYSK